MSAARGIGPSAGEAGYCAACDKHMPDGPDACLGWIPGVSGACCGHGDEERAYVSLGGGGDEVFCPDGLILQGALAKRFFDLVALGDRCYAVEQVNGKWQRAETSLWGRSGASPR